MEFAGFPKEWKNCPNCGSEERVVANIKKELVEQGRFNPEIPAVAQVITSPIIDPTRVNLQVTAPVLVALTDICAECGTLYAFSCTVQQGKLTPKNIPQPHQFPPRQNPFFNNPLSS